MKARITIWLAVLLLCGCAGGSRYTEEMNALIGNADKKTFVDKYGPPDKQAVVDGATEAWEYHLNEQRYTSPTGYRFSTYDRLRLMFKDGKLQSWSRESVTD